MSGLYFAISFPKTIPSTPQHHPLPFYTCGSFLQAFTLLHILNKCFLGKMLFAFSDAI